MYLPSPADFGSPSKFSEWRDGQDKLFYDILDSTKRFSIHNSPTGSGKSLGYMTAAIASGKRVAVLTADKGLQDQIVSDNYDGLFDMRGLQNYTCVALDRGGELESMWSKHWGRPTCDIGPCTGGMRCDLKNSGCHYFDAYRDANKARLLITNYAYWIAAHKYGQGLGTFDWLICDEAHSCDAQLSSALSAEFTSKDFRALGSRPPKITALPQVWRMWGRIQLNKIQGKLDFFARSAQIGAIDSDRILMLVRDTDLPDAVELRFWKRLEGKCTILSESDDDWAIEQDETSGNIRIAPVWVRSYAEKYLFRNIKRIVMTSATARPKITDFLGIHPGDCEFFSYPSTFPVNRRPIYWVPTVRLNYESPQEDLRSWVVRIDQILSQRMDRKGIIHTVSYKRQQYLLAHSRFRHIMHANTSSNTRDVVKSFRNADAPAVLVSPAVGTGFDFPFDAARFQIIGKVPFRDARGSILQAQAKEDPNYLSYLTAQDITQIYGRSNRAPDDYSETFCIDDSIEWFMRRYSGYHYDADNGKFDMSLPRNGESFFPEYLLEAFQRVGCIPPPLLSFGENL